MNKWRRATKTLFELSPVAGRAALAGVAVLCLLLALGTARALMENAPYTLDAGRIVGLAGRIADYDLEIMQVFGEAFGFETLSDGYITINSPYQVRLPETTLDGAYCYPSPFRPSRGHKKLIFGKLTGRVMLRIFDLSGALVYRTERDAPDGLLEWDATNAHGSPLASGVYIYLITSGDEKKTGRFAVIR